MKTLLKSAVAITGSSFSAHAATIIFDTEDFETSGDLGIWENATNQYQSNGLGAGNVLFDQTGTQADPFVATNFSGGAIRIRSSTGSLVLADPLPLATLGAIAVTITYDLRENTAGYMSVVQYSSDGEFQFDGDGDDTVTLASYDGNGTVDGTGANGEWRRYSHVISTGLTDTFQFRLGMGARGSGSNPTFHAWDNLVVSYEIIPEPSTALLGGIGGLFLLRRRRK